jgi:hypothetical protein
MQLPKIKKNIKITKNRIKDIFPYSTPSKRNSEGRVRAAAYAVATDMTLFAADDTEIKP